MTTRTLLVLAMLAAPAAASAQQGDHDAPSDNAMGFRPGLGDAARERVPGGRLLVGAYTTVLLLLGGYVAYIARKATRLDDDLRRLEDDLARRGGGDGDDDKAPTKDG